MQTEDAKKLYIIRQPGKADREFPSSTAAIRHLISNKGRAKLFADGKLILSKGFGQQMAG